MPGRGLCPACVNCALAVCRVGGSVIMRKVCCVVVLGVALFAGLWLWNPKRPDPAGRSAPTANVPAPIQTNRLDDLVAYLARSYGPDAGK